MDKNAHYIRYDTHMKSMFQSLIEKRSKILNDSVVVRNCGLIGHWNVARPMNEHHIEVDSLRWRQRLHWISSQMKSKYARSAMRRCCLYLFEDNN